MLSNIGQACSAYPGCFLDQRDRAWFAPLLSTVTLPIHAIESKDRSIAGGGAAKPNSSASLEMAVLYMCDRADSSSSRSTDQ